MSEPMPPESTLQHYAEEAIAWSASAVQAVVPDCPALRGVATYLLRTQATVLKGALFLVEAVLTKLEPPEAPHSEKIIIE
jgi:hypothetical protein